MLLRRLENDKSLAVFAGQFVPLKLVTGGNAEWAQWTQKYPVKGNGIPRLYVVRADGEQLYAAVGGLNGDALPRMMVATLQQAGRTFSPQEVEMLKSAVAAAEKAVADQQYGRAAGELSQLSKLGAIGNLQSFARPALQADAIAKTIVDASGDLVDKAVSMLNDPQSAFLGALALVEAEQQFSAFADVKRKISTAIRAAKRDAGVAAKFSQANAIHRARLLAKSDKPAIRKQAATAYESVIRRFPNTAADRLARQELAAVAPDATVLSESRPTPKPQFRTWTDSTGKFSVRATMVTLSDGAVTLRTENGKELTVPIDKLSEADRALLQKK